jgi:hypothetical protein
LDRLVQFIELFFGLCTKPKGPASHFLSRFFHYVFKGRTFLARS